LWLFRWVETFPISCYFFQRVVIFQWVVIFPKNCDFFNKLWLFQRVVISRKGHDFLDKTQKHCSYYPLFTINRGASSQFSITIIFNLVLFFFFFLYFKSFLWFIVVEWVKSLAEYEVPLFWWSKLFYPKRIYIFHNLEYLRKIILMI